MFNQRIRCIYGFCGALVLSAYCVGCAKLDDGRTIKNNRLSTQMTFADAPTELERKTLQTHAAKLSETLNEEGKNVNQASDVFESTKDFLKSSP
jgi:hypothetical protein